MGVSKIFKLLVGVALCIFAVFSSAYDKLQRIEEDNKHSKFIAGENQQILKKSMASSVKIISSFSIGDGDENSIVTSSSGTYFFHNNKRYIITAGHSLIGDCNSTQVIADEYAFNCIDIVSLDPLKDIGIFEVEDIFNREPITITDFLSTNESNERNTGVHEKTTYTGYPQGMGPFTFDGKIISHSITNDIFFIHSYAWSGSSGSGVFNSRGSLIGVITAVSLANSDYGVDVMEDLIIVTSIELIDLQNVL